MIDELSLYNFRNIKTARLEFSKSFNVIFGANGSGKTSIFEAIYFAGFGSSPFGASISDVILYGEEKSAVHAKGPLGKLSFNLDKNGSKKVLLDDKKINKMSDILGIFPQTIIGPQEVQIVIGAPSVRRKTMDMHLCQTNNIYTDALRNYSNVLSNRNAILKKPEKLSETLLDAITKELTEAGEVIIKARDKFIDGIKEKSSMLYNMISDGKLEVFYEPSFRGDAAEFKDALKSRIKREVRYGNTTLGPHRDEMAIHIDGKPAKDFASWGQKRIASIVILIAMSEFIHGERRQKPSILLDDCFAELDNPRTNKLLEIAPKWGQVFIATPKKINAPSNDAAYFEFESPGIVQGVQYA
ncbi:MAG: DNA replication/repair protein RecF [Candidatus Zixiibacteriota bacterium]